MSIESFPRDERYVQLGKYKNRYERTLRAIARRTTSPADIRQFALDTSSDGLVGSIADLADTRIALSTFVDVYVQHDDHLQKRCEDLLHRITDTEEQMQEAAKANRATDA